MPHIAHDGIETFYAERGDGPALVLIHGAEADHSMFDRLVPHLAPRFRCIAYDQRDSGETRNGTADYPIEQLADDVAGFIAALGLSARARVRHVARQRHRAAARRAHPQRVDRLVLSSAIRAGQVMTEFAPETATRLRRCAPIRSQTPMRLPQHFFPAAFLRTIRESSPRCAARASAEQSARRADLLRRRYELDLSTITRPTLVLVGAEDRLSRRAQPVDRRRHRRRRADRSQRRRPCRQRAGASTDSIIGQVL